LQIPENIVPHSKIYILLRGLHPPRPPVSHDF
jgi:hypothetical protein